MSDQQKAAIRGAILRYLDLVYPQAVTLRLLHGELDLFGFTVLMEDLSFHVAALAEKELVWIMPQTGLRDGVLVRLVKITAKGIDFQNALNRASAESPQSVDRETG